MIVPGGGGSTMAERKSREQIGTLGEERTRRQINHKINEFGSVCGDATRLARCRDVCGRHRPSRCRTEGGQTPWVGGRLPGVNKRLVSARPHDADIDNCSRATNIWTCPTHGYSGHWSSVR